MLTIHGTGLSFSIDENAQSALITGKGYTPAPEGNFWRMILDDGFFIEMLAVSSEQTGRAWIQGEELVIEYDEIHAHGRTFDVKLTVTVKNVDELLCFTATVTNNEKDVRVNEYACPLLEVTELNGPREKDLLFLPEGLGIRMPDPWNTLRVSHSDYMDGDEYEVVRSMYYPEASMAWMGVESNGQFLYIGRHDPEIHGTVMQASCSPYGKSPRLSLRYTHLPMARTGETVDVPPVCVGLLPGAWTEGAKTYREWAGKAFYRPVELKPWVKQMNGWQRIIMRSQYGDDYYRPEDLPALYEEGAKYGVDTIFLFGWWASGFDNHYPEYNTTPEHAQAVKENIAKVRAMGGRVILVCNANFIDADTEYGKKYGMEQSQLDRRGHARFRKCCYSPFTATRSLKMFGDSPIFLYPCSGSKAWRETLKSHFTMLTAYDPDSVFYDCYGIEPNGFCFNAKHEHGNRVDEEWKYKREVLSYVKKECGDDYVFGTEQVTDIAAAYTQFIHGCRGNFEPEAPFVFPNLFRQTFPEVVTTNRGARDSRPGFERNLRFSLVHGLRYDVEIYRCRRGMNADPAYSEEVAYLNGLRQKYADYMIEGTYDVSALPVLPDTIAGAQYLSADKKHRLTVLWNHGEETQSVCGVNLAPNEFHFGVEAL